jgi:hypothetical protein
MPRLSAGWLVRISPEIGIPRNGSGLRGNEVWFGITPFLDKFPDSAVYMYNGHINKGD